MNYAEALRKICSSSSSICMRWLFLGCLVCLLSACLPLGPYVLPANHLGYNVALYNSVNTQLLLNIVRVRYGGGIYFLDVSGISAQAVAEAGWSDYPTYNQTHSKVAGAEPTGTTLTESVTRTLVRTFQMSPKASYADKPTISYTPLQGAKVTTQFLSPLSTQAVYLLIRSGWSLYKVLRMTIQKMGSLNNIPTGEGLLNSCAPPNLKFSQLTRYLHHLEAMNAISFGLEKYSNARLKKEVDLSNTYKDLPKNTELAIVLRFAHTKLGRQGKVRLAKMLHLDRPYSTLYFFTSNDMQVRGNAIPIQMRSVESMIYYLSKGVQVSAQDFKSRAIEPTYCARGQLFDWTQVTRHVMYIYSSDSQPPKDAIQVYYRHKWFYIADSDNDSKRVLDLLNVIFALQAGERRGNVPALTLNI